jgi:hypothetical protein
LGEIESDGKQYQHPDLRKTYRHGQLGHVLFRLG